MSEEKKSNSFNTEDLKWHESIRKRPGMYLGFIEERAPIALLKNIMSFILPKTGESRISFEVKDRAAAKFKLTIPQSEIHNFWSDFLKYGSVPGIFLGPVLNALSKSFKIRFWNPEGKEIAVQQFEKGILTVGPEIQRLSITAFAIDFHLDESIWGDDFAWNTNFITQQIWEFAHLHKNTTFEISYLEQGEENKSIFNFRNGLMDRIDLEILNGYGGSYFPTLIDIKIGEFQIEAAFAFREYTVDAPYLKSYVNDLHTHENGTHVDGLLKGLTYGVMKYFQKHDLTRQYRISEKGMQEHLLAAINIKMAAPLFSGCVRNKLANPEVIEPIAEHVAEVLFRKIEADEASTERLIRKFHI